MAKMNPPAHLSAIFIFMPQIGGPFTRVTFDLNSAFAEYIFRGLLAEISSLLNPATNDGDVEFIPQDSM